MQKRNATVAVIGAGDYIGAEIVKKFASEGFTVFAGRRNGEKLAPLVKEVEDAGGTIFARSLDARKEEETTTFLKDADAHAPLELCIFNVGANVNFPILETTDRERARHSFRELAATAPAEALHRESISRLAYALGHLGEREMETSLLRRAQRAHPEDFWINHDLARSLMGAGRPDEAARFYSAALAVRPRSELVLIALGEALRAAGRTDEAARYPRRHMHPPGPGGRGRCRHRRRSW